MYQDIIEDIVMKSYSLLKQGIEKSYSVNTKVESITNSTCWTMTGKELFSNKEDVHPETIKPNMEHKTDRNNDSDVIKKKTSKELSRFEPGHS